MGFGILILGYFLAYAFSISSVYFFADIIGTAIIMLAFSKLAQYNRYFVGAMGFALGFLGSLHLFLGAVHNQLSLHRSGVFISDDSVVVGFFLVEVKRVSVCQTRLHVSVAENIRNLGFNAVFLSGALHFFAVSHLMGLREDILDLEFLKKLFLLLRVLIEI